MRDANELAVVDEYTPVDRVRDAGCGGRAPELRLGWLRKCRCRERGAPAAG
jgi:hypothetical protein